MRRFYFLSIMVSFTFFTGCFSANYTLHDFNSREEYYNKFNDFAKDNEFDLTFKNGNIVHIIEGSKILHDSLTFATYELLGKKTTVLVSSIKEIEYSSLDYKQAAITLRSGEKLKAKNIETHPGSLMFTAVKSTLTTETLPVKKIKMVRAEDTSLGIWSGIGLSFVGLGILVAAKIFPYVKHGNETEETFDGTAMLLLGIPATLIVGTIVGLLVGGNVNYAF